MLTISNMRMPKEWEDSLAKWLNDRHMWMEQDQRKYIREMKSRLSLKPCSDWTLIIFNWIIVQSVIFPSILLNYGFVHICENSNKQGRVTSLKLKTKWRPIDYRTAAMIFTAWIWRPEERQGKLRRLEEEKYAVWNSNNGWHSFWLSKHLPLFWPFVQSRTVITSNNPLKVDWSNYNPIIIRDCD